MKVKKETKIKISTLLDLVSQAMLPKTKRRSVTYTHENTSVEHLISARHFKGRWICGSFLEGVTSPLCRSHFSCGVSLGLAGPQQSSTAAVCQLPAASGRSYHLGYYFREALESSLQPPHHHGRHQKKKQKEHFRKKTQKNQIAARDVSLPFSIIIIVVSKIFSWGEIEDIVSNMCRGDRRKIFLSIYFFNFLLSSNSHLIQFICFTCMTQWFGVFLQSCVTITTDKELVFCFFSLHHLACEILVPRPGIEPAPTVVGAWRF